MRELGYRSGSTYKQNSTSTYNDNSAYQLIQLGFNVQKDEYSDKFILGSIPPNGLGEKGAVIISARDSVEGRHMWMIDGYRNIIKRYTHQLVNPGLGPGLESEPTYETFHYNHYNWGWDGNYNGYFISGNYRCGSLNLNKDQIFYSVSL